MARSNQGHNMAFAQLQPLTNVPAKYQLPTPFGCRDIAWTNFSCPPIRTPWMKTIPRQPVRAVG